jgi:Fibronectin type III domain
MLLGFISGGEGRMRDETKAKQRLGRTAGIATAAIVVTIAALFVVSGWSILPSSQQSGSTAPPSASTGSGLKVDSAAIVNYETIECNATTTCGLSDSLLLYSHSIVVLIVAAQTNKTPLEPTVQHHYIDFTTYVAREVYAAHESYLYVSNATRYRATDWIAVNFTSATTYSFTAIDVQGVNTTSGVVDAYGSATGVTATATCSLTTATTGDIAINDVYVETANETSISSTTGTQVSFSTLGNTSFDSDSASVTSSGFTASDTLATAGRWVSTCVSLVPAGVPPAPHGLVVTQVTQTTAILNWTNPAGPLTKFDVFQATQTGGSCGAFASIKTYTQTASDVLPLPDDYVVPSLVVGTTYCFNVEVSNLTGFSSPSSTVTATPVSFVPLAPTGFAVTSDNGASASFAWTNPAGTLTGVQIVASFVEEGTCEIATNFVVLYSTSTVLTGYTATNLDYGAYPLIPGNTISSEVEFPDQCYAVQAENTFGWGALSSSVSPHTGIAGIYNPTNLSSQYWGEDYYAPGNPAGTPPGFYGHDYGQWTSTCGTTKTNAVNPSSSYDQPSPDFNGTVQGNVSSQVTGQGSCSNHNGYSDITAYGGTAGSDWNWGAVATTTAGGANTGWLVYPWKTSGTYTVTAEYELNLSYSMSDYCNPSNTAIESENASVQSQAWIQHWSPGGTTTSNSTYGNTSLWYKTYANVGVCGFTTGTKTLSGHGEYFANATWTGITMTSSYIYEVGVLWEPGCSTDVFGSTSTSVSSTCALYFNNASGSTGSQWGTIEVVKITVS